MQGVFLIFPAFPPSISPFIGFSCSWAKHQAVKKEKKSNPAFYIKEKKVWSFTLLFFVHIITLYQIKSVI
ncbi:MAG TPA: hypothetical protein DDW53_00260 [Lachnoclostridium sp.]|nr:hypothetical protein [Lachnoclostridium sp.]